MVFTAHVSSAVRYRMEKGTRVVVAHKRGVRKATGAPQEWTDPSIGWYLEWRNGCFRNLNRLRGRYARSCGFVHRKIGSSSTKSRFLCFQARSVVVLREEGITRVLQMCRSETSVTGT